MHVIKKTNKEVQTTHEIMIVHDGRVVSETNVEGKDDRKLNLGNSSQTHYSKAAGDVRFTVLAPGGSIATLKKQGMSSELHLYPTRLLLYSIMTLCD
jgi:hypothetical protein